MFLKWSKSQNSQIFILAHFSIIFDNHLSITARALLKWWNELPYVAWFVTELNGKWSNSTMGFACNICLFRYSIYCTKARKVLKIHWQEHDWKEKNEKYQICSQFLSAAFLSFSPSLTLSSLSYQYSKKSIDDFGFCEWMKIFTITRTSKLAEN